MAGISPVDSGLPSADLAVREPRQRRTREQWERVLDAGVRLLEEGGYEGFTILTGSSALLGSPHAISRSARSQTSSPEAGRGERHPRCCSRWNAKSRPAPRMLSRNVRREAGHKSRKPKHFKK